MFIKILAVYGLFTLATQVLVIGLAAAKSIHERRQALSYTLDDLRARDMAQLN